MNELSNRNSDIVANTNVSAVPMYQYDDIERRFQTALQVVDDIVLKNYVQRLREFDIVPMDSMLTPAEKAKDLSKNVRLFKVTEMVYEKDEFAPYKFASVFNALSTTNCSVFVIIDSNGEKTDFYMGIRSFDEDLTPNFLKETLKNAMKGQFPGIKTKDFLDEDMHTLLDKKVSNISIVSCVANSKDTENRQNSSFVQGLEKLVFAMQGQRYTAVILANATSQAQIDEIRRSYEKIYSQLAPFAKTQMSYSTNESQNFSIGTSTSKSDGTTHTDNTSSTQGKSTNSSTTKSNSVSKEGTASKVTGALSAVSNILGMALAPSTGGASLLVSGVLGGAISGVGQVLRKTTTDGDSATTGTGKNWSDTKGSSDSTTHTDTKTTNENRGVSSGTGQNMTLNLENRTLSGMLDRINTQLERLQEFESLGMWECSAYFMSEKQYAAEIAAATYKSLMRGENSGVEVCAINSWRSHEKQEVKLLSEYALNLRHPTFSYDSAAGSIQVTPCTLVSGNELAIHMGLPRQSVCGFPVIEHADFGKEVVSYTHEKAQAAVNLGNIFNMGSESENSVRLDRNSLSMHTFVTGSTGSGKSNTVYELLRQLDTVGVKFLVVEPAKGEYKNVFGHSSNVSVFGTNPHYAELLRINPFKFPKGIHVLEHVDRLIEIFNVCWPMYAAMPAVLKEAILQAYEVCGWDLEDSTNDFGENLFPTFKDLLSELEDVIDKSSYDKEVKSNYKGSLETRIRSLANGLNGQIFSTGEVDNSILFDKNVIVDLSRVGSLETKSLIMGILVMRLNEYRMSETDGMNIPLKHITVLEEAHNILKRTSGEGAGPEGANMAGKSVEMLSNAIAEMRTYGEGFIIADQSPSAVDASAIRNTNTKIIMRLPDEADRRMAGKAAALKDNQLDEIAKLPRGVAVIYQNDWLEPVLCKIKKFEGPEKPYVKDTADDYKSDDSVWVKNEILGLLLHGILNTPLEIDVDKIQQLLPHTSLSTKTRILITQALHEFEKSDRLSIWNSSKFDEVSMFVFDLLEVKSKVARIIKNAKNVVELNNSIEQLLKEQGITGSPTMMQTIEQCLMYAHCLASGDNVDSEKYKLWKDYVLGKGDTK